MRWLRVDGCERWVRMDRIDVVWARRWKSRTYIVVLAVGGGDPGVWGEDLGMTEAEATSAAVAIRVLIGAPADTSTEAALRRADTHNRVRTELLETTETR